MQMDIFEFAITDYQNVISLWKSCEGIGLSSADSKDSLEAYLKRNPGMSFVAISQNEIIGAVLCGHDGRRGYLHHLAVHPDYRKQGIGRSLVAKCVTALQMIGIQKCHLFIFGRNIEGIRFWEKIGWIRREDIGVVSREIDFKKPGGADK
jgi:ribosomal protein S18 acetylase RimI-like enzyme